MTKRELQAEVERLKRVQGKFSYHAMRLALEIEGLGRDNAKLRRFVLALAERVAAQSELLAKKANRPDPVRPP